MKNKLAIILSSALIVVCTLCITLSSFAGAGRKRGDVNLDGKVSLLDAKYVLQYIADMRTLSQSAVVNADADGDGDIDLTDAKYILEAVAGIRKLSDIDIGTSEFDSSGYIDLDDSTNPSTTRKQSITIEHNDNTKDATIDWRN
jgi:hypothetical protein